MSLIGIRLGMDEAELVRALPADLKPTLQRSEMVLSGVPFVSVEAGKPDCGWGRLPDIGRPCVGFRAFLLKHDADGVLRVANVSLDQFFETPVPYDVLRQRLLGAFGTATAEVLRSRMPAQPASPGTTAEVRVSIGAEAGPRIGAQSGPLCLRRTISPSELVGVAQTG
ncbi:MAG: hypothetical protein O9254_00565 [Rhodobacteraceae bacterium]|nr:hypothetical protein [Paracoccaceae bacterium]